MVAGRAMSFPAWHGSILCTKERRAQSTRCGGNGFTVFYGMAKPVRAPQIGPAEPL
jgi:hypothetical protein